MHACTYINVYLTYTYIHLFIKSITHKFHQRLLGSNATITADEVNCCNFSSAIHSVKFWGKRHAVLRLSVLMVGRFWIWQETSHATMSPKLEIPAWKCRIYCRTGPLWTAFRQAAQTPSMGITALLFM